MARPGPNTDYFRNYKGGNTQVNVRPSGLQRGTGKNGTPAAGTSPGGQSFTNYQGGTKKGALASAPMAANQSGGQNFEAMSMLTLI